MTLKFYVRVKEDLDVEVTTTLLNQATIADFTASVEIETTKPRYSAVKTVVDGNKNERADQGETLTYTLEITNDGLIDVENMFVQDELLTIKDYFVSVDDETLTLNGDDSFTVKDLIGGFELNLPVGETIHISFDLVLKSDLDMEAIYLIRNIAKVNELNPSTNIRTLIPETKTIDKPDPKPPVTPPVVKPPVVTPPVVTPPIVTPPVVTPPVITPPIVKPVVAPVVPVDLPSLPATGVSSDVSLLPLLLIAIGLILRRRTERH